MVQFKTKALNNENDNLFLNDAPAEQLIAIYMHYLESFYKFNDLT